MISLSLYSVNNYYKFIVYGPNSLKISTGFTHSLIFGISILIGSNFIDFLASSYKHFKSGYFVFDTYSLKFLISYSKSYKKYLNIFLH